MVPHLNILCISSENLTTLNCTYQLIYTRHSMHIIPSKLQLAPSERIFNCDKNSIHKPRSIALLHHHIQELYNFKNGPEFWPTLHFIIIISTDILNVLHIHHVTHYTIPLTVWVVLQQNADGAAALAQYASSQLFRCISHIDTTHLSPITSCCTEFTRTKTTNI